MTRQTTFTTAADASKTLERLGLPANLFKLIRDGRLFQVIEQAERQVAVMNDALDAWEAANPEAAALAPWADSRRAWKLAGRPPAPWYELLRACQTRTITANELMNMIPEFGRMYAWGVVKNDEERRKAYHQLRRTARDQSKARQRQAARELRAQAESTV